MDFPVPPPSQQRKIARILTTVDNLIEKTEALIAKYQAIKQGMMHDLFTRGVDEHGHLRPGLIKRSLNSPVSIVLSEKICCAPS
jgi:type I restriction enzyme S subunit